MKRLMSIITALLLLLGAAAQSVPASSKGTDFWVAFLHNNGEAGTPDLSLRALCDQSAVITVTNPSTNWSTTLNLTSTAYSNVAHAEIAIPWAQGLNATPSAITNYGLHVTSTADITLIATNHRLASADAALIIPTAQLGTRYIVQDYPNSTSSESASISGCNIVFLATEDHTVLTMVLPCVTQPHTVDSGSTLNITLNRGQTYMLVTPTPNQFSGMEVNSNGHPFAMFQGNRITSVVNGNYSSGDHIYEQAMPVDTWGTDFVITATYGRTWGDLVRLTAGDGYCYVDVDGTSETVIAPFETYDYHLPGSTTKHIHTSSPASATLLMASSTWNAQPGDVSSITLTPMDAGVSDAMFSVWNTERCNSHYVAIATTPSAVSGMTLDGNSISTQFFGTGNYRHALISVAAGEHHLACASGTFTGYVYGMGNVESYAYPLARSFPEYTYDTLDITDTVCMGQPVDTMGIYLPPHVTSHLGDTIVHRDITIGSVRTHLQIHLTVMPVWVQEIYDTLSVGDTIWVGDSALTHAGFYLITLSTIFGCDSSIIVHLSMLADTVHFYDTTCQGQSYNNLGFTLDDPQRSTVLERDTIEEDVPRHIILHLTVMPTARSDIYRSIVLGDTLYFADTALCDAGEYQFTYTAANGCDSLLVLHLSYEEIGLIADKDGICPGDEVTLTATGTHTFRWQSSPPDPELDSLQDINPIIVHPLVTTVYSLIDAEGNTVASVLVGTAPPPIPCVECNRTELDFDNPVLIFTDCSEGRHHTTWTFDDGATFTGTKTRRQFLHPLPDSVSVTMTTCNRYNCCADTTIALPMKIRSVWFPNIFTPDAESNNLFGCHTSYDVAEFHMVIFNRWGIELWSTEDINSQWDGRRHDGTPCPQGAYVYRYWITSSDGTFKSAIGTVTLIR